ncbi:unnamed protein product [Urochloa humidicola]
MHGAHLSRSSRRHAGFVAKAAAAAAAAESPFLASLSRNPTARTAPSLSPGSVAKVASASGSGDPAGGAPPPGHPRARLRRHLRRLPVLPQIFNNSLDETAYSRACSVGCNCKCS